MAAIDVQVPAPILSFSTARGGRPVLSTSIFAVCHIYKQAVSGNTSPPVALSTATLMVLVYAPGIAASVQRIGCHASERGKVV